MKKILFYTLGCMVVLSILVVACKRNAVKVFTSSVTGVTGMTAFCGGDVTDDGGNAILAKGVCWSTNKKPTCADQHLVAADHNSGAFTCKISGLVPSTTYHVRAFVTYSDGTVYGNEVVFTTSDDQNTIADIDGNVYGTVVIGNQVWMRENLRTTHFADGTPIPDHTNDKLASYSKPILYRPLYNGSHNPPAEYGLLYNWPAVMHGKSPSSANPSGVQGVCPDGWHVPSTAEWKEMIDYVRDNEEFIESSKCVSKALASTTGWEKKGYVGRNPQNNNSTGFSALPVGWYSPEFGNFLKCGEYCGFWTASSGNEWALQQVWMDTYLRSPYYAKGTYDESDSYSVRCVMDN